MGKIQSKKLKPEKLIALFDHYKETKDELAFFKGDELIKINRIDEKSILAKNLRNDRTGIVNVDHILPADSYELQPWFFGRYSRVAAEIQLMSSKCEDGCFLVRESETTDMIYTLSVIYNESNSKFVKHFKVNYDSKRFFLTSKRKFKTLTQLVAYYSKKKDGQCHLSLPCEKIIKKDEYLNLKMEDVLVDERSQINSYYRECSGFKGYLKDDTEVMIKLSKYCSSKQLLNEVEFLKKIDNKNVIRLVGASVNFPYVLGCFENFPFNDLETHLKSNKINKFNIVKIGSQFCSAMIYLTNKSIIHRNIRAKNVLICRNYFVKLANFDFAIQLDLNKQFIVECVPEDISVRWMAYEIVKGCEKTGFKIYSEKSEVWAFAIMLYEMFSRKEPYEGINDDKTIIKKLIENDFRLPDPQPFCEETTSTFYNNIITKCWPKCYVMRPTFNELKEIFLNYFDVFEPDYIYPKRVKFEESQNLQIDYETCDIIDQGVLLQSGNYSEIWKGIQFINNQVVIIKKFKKLAINAKSFDLNMRKFLHESRILKKLNNKNIVKLLGISRINEFYIILEYVLNGSLDAFLKSPKGNFVNFDQIVNFAEQISSGMKYLELTRIVHADLAARNILVGEKDLKDGFHKIKIGDFELSHELGDQEKILIPIKNRIEIAARWTAPEIVIGENDFRIFSIKSDVYSFGLVLYELITKGQIPFKDVKHEDLLEKVFKGNYVFKKEELNCPDEFFNIMKSCINFNRDKRPNFATVHQWFINYSKCYVPEIDSNEKLVPVSVQVPLHLTNELEIIEMTKL